MGHIGTGFFSGCANLFKAPGNKYIIPIEHQPVEVSPRSAIVGSALQPGKTCRKTFSPSVSHKVDTDVFWFASYPFPQLICSVIIFLNVPETGDVEGVEKSATDQELKELLDQWDQVKGKMYRPGTNLPSFSDTLDMALSWDEIFRSSGFDRCYCPTPEQVHKMPREFSPYQWINKDQPIMINDSTYQEWIKSEQSFKKMYQHADSLQLKKKKPVIL